VPDLCCIESGGCLYEAAVAFFGVLSAPLCVCAAAFDDKRNGMGNCPTQMESMGRTGILLTVLPQISARMADIYHRNPHVLRICQHLPLNMVGQRIPIHSQ
jgi:hypothetical protein